MEETSHPIVYSELNLIQLASLIDKKSDQDAMRELLEKRKFFRTHREKDLTFWEYIWHLRKCLSRINEKLGESTFDRVIERFTHFPRKDGASKKSGPDCRKQYKAFVKRFPHQENIDNKDVTLDMLRNYEREFQILVRRHFTWCQQECQRNIEGWNRYDWIIKKKKISIYLPLKLHSRERSKWLKENIPDVNPDCPEEKKRIQAIVDQHYRFQGYILSLEESNVEFQYDNASGNQLDDEMLYGHTATQLKIQIAKEKGDNLEKIRPCIRELGSCKIRSLVMRILEDLDEDCYHPSVLAAEFGVDPSCISRFAGKEWEDGKIPDLYKNIANYLASKPEFIKASKESGVWDAIEKIESIPGKKS